MSIIVQCSKCHRKYKAEDQHVGKRTKCPGCGQPLTIPATSVPNPSCACVVTPPDERSGSNTPKPAPSPEVNRLVEALHDKDLGTRRDAVQALGKLGGVDAVSHLIAALIDKSLRVTDYAADQLAKLRPSQALEPLIGIVKDRTRDECHRGHAAYALGELGDPRAEGALLAALEEADQSELCSKAAIALGKLGDSRALEPLIAALRERRNRFLREGAATGLGKLGDPRAVEPLIAALKDPSREVACAAATALGEIGELRAVDPLTVMLNHSESSVCLCAARALGKLGDAKALAAVMAVRDHKHYALSWVRDAVDKAIEAIDPSGTKRATLEIRPRPEGEKIEELGDMMVNDTSNGSSYARKLGEIGSPEAIEQLMCSLERGCRRGLAHDTFKRAVKELLRLDRQLLSRRLCSLFRELPYLHGPKPSIVLVLAELADQEAIQTLQLATSDKDNMVASYARDALAKLSKTG